MSVSIQKFCLEKLFNCNMINQQNKKYSQVEILEFVKFELMYQGHLSMLKVIALRTLL